MLISVVLYLGFGLTYNAVCSQCSGLTNPYWVMQNSLMDPVQYLVLVISGILSILPRYIMPLQTPESVFFKLFQLLFRIFIRVVTNTLQPTEVVTAVRVRRRERDTKKMLENVETKAGFIKFFRF